MRFVIGMGLLCVGYPALAQPAPTGSPAVEGQSAGAPLAALGRPLGRQANGALP
jgi:hypothetical protein